MKGTRDHSLCAECFGKMYPGRMRITLSRPWLDRCCGCGKPHEVGDAALVRVKAGVLPCVEHNGATP